MTRVESRGVGVGGGGGGGVMGGDHPFDLDNRSLTQTQLFTCDRILWFYRLHNSHHA